MKRNDEPSAPVTFKVAEIKAHPQFSRVGFYNDIAILELDGQARKTKYVIPLCLPPPQLRNEKFAGKRTTVVGWGTTYYGNDGTCTYMKQKDDLFCLKVGRKVLPKGKLFFQFGEMMIVMMPIFNQLLRILFVQGIQRVVQMHVK